MSLHRLVHGRRVPVVSQPHVATPSAPNDDSFNFGFRVEVMFTRASRQVTPVPVSSPSVVSLLRDVLLRSGVACGVNGINHTLWLDAEVIEYDATIRCDEDEPRGSTVVIVAHDDRAVAWLAFTFIMGEGDG